MRVSVLLACWNAERYVADAVRSILEQEPAPAEIICVDDGSTDGSSAILESFVPRVTLLQQSNRGVAAALNLAAANASGEAIAFLDADDLWLPGNLGLRCAALAADPDVDGVFGHVRVFASPDLPPAERAGLRIDETAQPGFNKSSLLVRRTAFDRVGGFDDTRRGADFIDWYARAVTVGFRWKMLRDVVCLRRVHSENMGRRDRARQRDDYLLTMKDFLDRKRAL
jgi:glycosyltransferase involved in cell wall biosynthesis